MRYYHYLFLGTLWFAAPAAAQQVSTASPKLLLDLCGSTTKPAAQSVTACHMLLADPRIQNLSATPAGQQLIEGIYYDLGVEYERLNHFPEAVQSYTAALKLNQNDVQALGNRGADYMLLNEYQPAITDFTQAIALAPQDYILFMNRGATYDQAQHYQAALADLNRAVAMAPQDPMVYFDRGNVYRHLKKFDQAIADYNQAIRLSPHYAEAFANRSLAYETIGQHAQAVQDCAKARSFAQAGYQPTCPAD